MNAEFTAAPAATSDGDRHWQTTGNDKRPERNYSSPVRRKKSHRIFQAKTELIRVQPVLVDSETVSPSDGERVWSINKKKKQYDATICCSICDGHV